jgi:hypothetical protein
VLSALRLALLAVSIYNVAMSDQLQIPIDDQLSVEEAKAIMAGGLGEFELRLVTSFCVPLAWREYDDHGAIVPRNGTAFFLNTGARVIGVTAHCGLMAGEPTECFNPNAAVMRAEVLSRKEGHVGAVAFSRTGDPATGNFQRCCRVEKIW